MAPRETKFKVAAAHAAPIYMNKVATIKKTVELIEQAALEHIKILVFPETFIPGYPVEFLAEVAGTTVAFIYDYWTGCYPRLRQIDVLAKYIEESVVVEPNGEDVLAIQDACRRTGIAINLGISERVANGHTIFNSQVIIDSDGTILGVHRKLQPTFGERMVWAQGNGSTLRNWPLSIGYNLGGLCCWEHTMNGARQALLTQNEHIHAAAWPALTAFTAFDGVGNEQIEALMKTHAFTAQAFVICASDYVDKLCLDWMEENLGPQDFVKLGGGWSSIVHPFCSFIAEPHTGAVEKLVQGEIDLAQINKAKVWNDGAGHYRRPEILQFSFDPRPHWDDEKIDRFGPRVEEKKSKEETGNYAQ